MPSWYKRKRWAALAGAVLLTIGLPIALDQGYFRYNAYALPVLGLCAAILYLGFFRTSATFRSWGTNFRNGFGKRHPVMGLIATILIFSVVGGLIGVAWWIALEASKRHVSALMQRDNGTQSQTATPIAQEHPPAPQHQPQPAPPIALTLRFDPAVLFPFSVPPHTTSYAVLAHPKIQEPWGAWEIRNTGAEPLSWPENDFEWAEPKKLRDMALAIDLANHSSNDLVNVQLTFKFEFLKAIREGTTSRSGDSIGIRQHIVVVPVIAAKSSVRIYVSNQSSKHFTVVSFPTEATVLVAGESERRTIKLIKTGVDIVDALPLFSLGPARVRWRGLGQPD